jgi:hypothetical protein
MSRTEEKRPVDINYGGVVVRCATYEEVGFDGEGETCVTRV